MIEDFDDYDVAAMRTESSDSIAPRVMQGWEMELLNAGLGLSGEGGEFVDHIKKYLFHGHTLDWKKLDKEAGDILWYLAQYAKVRNIPLRRIAQENIEKLTTRYPEKFDSQRSINKTDG